MSWLSREDNEEQRITVVSPPIKKVQAFRILGLDDDLEALTEEERMEKVEQTAQMFDVGLIDIDTARKHLGLKRYY